MKKTRILAAATVLSMVLAATGCGEVEESSSVMTLGIANEKECTIEFENADAENMVSSGSLIVEEGEELLVEPSMEEGGKIVLKLQQITEEETADEVPEYNDPDYEIPVEGSESAQYEVDPGEYHVEATPEVKSTGMIVVRVVAAEEEAVAEEETDETADEADGHTNWTECATAEEAAAGAGLDSLVDLNGTKISLGELGTMGSITYRYMDGIAQIFCPAAAVEMSVIKGKVPAGDGDVSFDNDAYKYEWTQDVDGQEVQCFGNREGEATKTIWTDGEYNYAVVAYGAGGDDDYGLPAEDVAIMVNAVK